MTDRVEIGESGRIVCCVAFVDALSCDVAGDDGSVPITITLGWGKLSSDVEG